MPTFGPIDAEEHRPARIPALSAVALAWAGRSMWAVCVCVYLTVFIGGIQAGGDELMSLGRAVGFTLAAAVLARIALGLMADATVPAEVVPSADKDGSLGPHPDQRAEANVGEQEDVPKAA